MPRVIDREMIKDFSESVDCNVADNAFSILTDCFEDIASVLASSNPLLRPNDIEIVKAFDYATQTATEISNLDIFVSVKSAQIELNSIENLTGIKNAFKQKIIDAYRLVKSRKRRAIKKRNKEEKRKKKQGISEKDLVMKKTKPYSIITFKDDCFNMIVERVSSYTIAYNMSNRIELLSSEEFGINVNLYPVIKLGDDYKVWSKKNAKFKIIRPKNAEETILEKNIDNNYDNVLKLIRIYKYLYFNIYNNTNYRFIESLIVNLPDKIFDSEDIYEVFLKSINFLSLANISKYKSAYNKANTIFEEDDISYYEYKKFIKEISKLI